MKLIKLKFPTEGNGGGFGGAGYGPPPQARGGFAGEEPTTTSQVTIPNEVCVIRHLHCSFTIC